MPKSTTKAAAVAISNETKLAELEAKIAEQDQYSSRLNDWIEKADYLASALANLTPLIASAGEDRHLRQWFHVVEAVCCQMSQILEGSVESPGIGDDDE